MSTLQRDCGLSPRIKALIFPDDDTLKQAISLKERISKIEEILEMGDFFFKDPEVLSMKKP